VNSKGLSGNMKLSGVNMALRRHVVCRTWPPPSDEALTLRSSGRQEDLWRFAAGSVAAPLSFDVIGAAPLTV